VWAITSFYNPVGYARRLSNYKIFRETLGIPLVTLELSFNGRFELTADDADVLIQISGGAVLWQKERLLNLALAAVPGNVENIAWLDCDIILRREDWVAEAENRLKRLNVVQLFSDAVFIPPEDYRTALSRENGFAYVPGLVSLSDARDLILIGSNLVRNSVKYVTGFAWAAKRRILEAHGFYDAAIAGSGDSLMAAAMFGRHVSISKRYMFNEARERHYFRWAAPFCDAVVGRVGCIPGTLFHLKHGELENRGYADRQQVFSKFDFDPDVDLEVGPNGAWHWARPRPDLEEHLRKYFVSRAEDA
jgi:hypothetical protein